MVLSRNFPRETDDNHGSHRKTSVTTELRIGPFQNISTEGHRHKVVMFCKDFHKSLFHVQNDFLGACLNASSICNGSFNPYSTAIETIPSIMAVLRILGLFKYSFKNTYKHKCISYSFIEGFSVVFLPREVVKSWPIRWRVQVVFGSLFQPACISLETLSLSMHCVKVVQDVWQSYSVFGSSRICGLL
jgi:hypothetical protein